MFLDFAISIKRLKIVKILGFISAGNDAVFQLHMNMLYYSLYPIKQEREMKDWIRLSY